MNEKFNGFVEELKTVIDKYDKYIITGHEKPDGDAIGSCIGFANYLKGIGKKVDVCLKDIPEHFEFLEGFEEIISEDEGLKKAKNGKYDVAIYLDGREYHRFGERKAIIEYVEKTICIDHHIGDEKLYDLQYVETESPAAAQTIYYILLEIERKRKSKKFSVGCAKTECKCREVNLNKKVLKPLLTGIITDTGGFRYPGVSDKTFEVAQKAYEQGITTGEIYENVFAKTLETFELEKLALSRLKIEDGVAITYLDNEDEIYRDSKPGEVDGVVGIPKSIKGVYVSIFLKEDEEGTKGSLRANNRYGYINCNEIAQKFNGGGHKGAAGFKILGKPKQVKEEIFEEVKKIIELQKNEGE